MVFVLVLFGALTSRMTLADEHVTAGKLLIGKIDYLFVGHREQKDDAGRLLVWEATINGDLNGRMKWWFVDPPPLAPVKHGNGRTSFYAARWELWSDNELRLAGESAGKTVFSGDADGIWDGHGRVTEASGNFSALVGHRVYESGPVNRGNDPPRTLSGTGMFMIY